MGATRRLGSLPACLTACPEGYQRLHTEERRPAGALLLAHSVADSTAFETSRRGRGKDGRAVVAVLGLAHLNGVRTILTTSRTV